jgi:hypothetical protein
MEDFDSMEAILRKTHSVLNAPKVDLRPGDVVARSQHFYYVTDDMRLVGWNQADKTFEELELSRKDNDVVYRQRNAEPNGR